MIMYGFWVSLQPNADAMNPIASPPTYAKPFSTAASAFKIDEPEAPMIA